MRIFNRFPEALAEIKRDLKEMGIVVKTRTMQNRDISKNPDFETLEIQNYIYTVTEPRLDDLPGVTQPWASAEWKEREDISIPGGVNPGEAWKLRRDVWEPLLVGENTGLHNERRFDYTYSERFTMNGQIEEVIITLKRDPASRRAFIAIWDSGDAWASHEPIRVPCSLGYLLQIRGGRLNITYFMRSCDFSTHFQNDIYLALRLQSFISQEINVPPGQFTHYMGSCHVYHKDVAGVF